MKRLLLIMPVLVPLAVVAADKAKNEKSDQAASAAAPGVNWAGQVVRATGSGAPDMRASNPAQARLGAEKAAQMDAFRNLLQQVKGIRISGGQTVGDALVKDELRGRVEGVIRGYRVTAKRYFSDSGVEMDVEVPLAALAEVLAPAAEPIVVPAKGEKKHTGLVVDARGLKVQPALAPRLLDAEGKPLYGSHALSADARKKEAVAAFVSTVEEATKLEKSGDKPLVVKATKAEGSDLFLSADDVKTLSETDQSYLAQGRVVIVTN